jgi:hypothetical protein
MDPFSLTTAIVTLVKSCIDVTKSIQPKDGKNSNISAKDFSNLQNNLINISRYSETLIEQITQKDKEIDKLKQILEDKHSFLFKKYYYFKVGDNGNVIDGPFCQKCYETNKWKIHLLPGGEKGRWWCTACNRPLYDDDHHPQPTGQKWWTEEPRFH